jgi:hypothetical protein
MRHGTRLLLTNVYAPYGITDDEHEASFGMLADALKVHLTYGQGVHSPQAAQPSFALHLLATNVSVPTTVLDFPTWDQFVRELGKGYTHVGISFIMANTLKAKRMAEHVRAAHPGMRIVLGGFGSMVPGIEDLVPNDGVCRIEGVRWLREYLGEDPEAPIVHPVLPFLRMMKVYGIDVARLLKSCLVIAGLGCKWGCDFCAATLLMGYRKYVPLVRDGYELFELCRQAEAQCGTVSLKLQDDNFLKNSSMGPELLAAMERHGKAYRFTAYGSADAVSRLGADFLVRLGIEQVWIGIESRSRRFEKLDGVDLHALIGELRRKGVCVTTSSMLFMEHHGREEVAAEIEWALSLHTEIHQFAIFTPIPGTCAYDRMYAKGLLPRKPDLRALHGMTLVTLNPDIPADEARRIQLDAYRRKYAIDGPASLNMCRTMARGYLQAVADCEERERQGLRWDPETLGYVPTDHPGPDTYMHLRIAEMRERAVRAWPMLLACRVLAPNPQARAKAKDTERLYREAFGAPSLFVRAASFGVLLFALLEEVKIRVHRRFTGLEYIPYQPRMQRTRYRGNARSRAPATG